MLNLNDASSSLDAAYKVLGVEPTATDDRELKAAYRRLALKNHPDRVASLGEEVRKAAEKKFQEINAARRRCGKRGNEGVIGPLALPHFSNGLPLGDLLTTH